MENAKERIIKILLRVIRLANLPIWHHTKAMLTVILMLWGRLVFLRFNEAQRWEVRGSEVIQISVLGSAFILAVWLLSGFANYCQYSRFPAYLKLVSASRFIGRILWYGVISSVIVLVILGVLFGVGT